MDMCACVQALLARKALESFLRSLLLLPSDRGIETASPAVRTAPAARALLTCTSICSSVGSLAPASAAQRCPARAALITT
jgi:hypothetical protein